MKVTSAPGLKHMDNLLPKGQYDKKVKFLSSVRAKYHPSPILLQSAENYRTFSFILSKVVVDIVRVRINAIRFIFFEADVT